MNTVGASPYRHLKRWLTRTITRKLLAAFVLVFLATYLATAAVVLSAVRSAVTRAELDTLAQLAHLKLSRLDTRFDQLATDLRAWSRLDVMNDLASGDVDKRIERALENLKGDYALKGQLYAFNAAGRLLATTAGGHPSATLPAAWAVHGSLGFIDKHPNPLGSGDIIALSMPVTSSFSPGFNLGTLVLTYPWSEIEATLADHAVLLQRQTRPLLLAAALPGASGSDILAALANVDADGWIRIGGHDYLTNSARSTRGLLSGWQLVVLREPRSLDRTLDTVALELAALCALLALPLTLAIRWLARRLTAPLRELTRVVTGITETGDLSRRVTLRSDDELGTLATAFNHMTVRLEGAARERELFVRELEQSAQELEHKVRERTRALTVANNELSHTLAELRSAQGQLIQQEKMASLGQLVAGVAHELNNPIGFIYANFPHLEEYADTLFALLDEMRNLPLAEEDRRRLEQRLEQAELDFVRADLLKIIRSGQSGATRIKEIISSLRSFSRLDEAVEKTVRLEEGLDDTLALLQHQLKNRIEVQRDYQLNLPVLCHPGQLNQVFMNILHNAVQAIDGPGTIHVGTRREGDWAVVTIADSGRGIPPEVQSRIFDPFFTTKKVGEGTGLGLSISYGIVEKHGGRIEVASTPGQGTTFTLHLPLQPTGAKDSAHE